MKICGDDLEKCDFLNEDNISNKLDKSSKSSFLQTDKMPALTQEQKL